MADAPHPDAWRVTVRRRLVIVAVIFAVWSTAVQARLLWLQVHEHEHLLKKATNQIARILTLPALRGTITDREGRSWRRRLTPTPSFAVPTAIDNPESTADKLCRALERCSKQERAALVEKLSKRRAFTYVRRQVSPAEASAVLDLKLDGVGLTKESRRFYPMRELMAGVLGYVGFDNRGLAGIELEYNDLGSRQRRQGAGVHRCQAPRV